MTTSRILLALAALALPLSACSKEPADPYDTDSQSHWLQSVSYTHLRAHET